MATTETIFKAEPIISGMIKEAYLQYIPKLQDIMEKHRLQWFK
jgi:hypothetical protein